MLAIEVNTPPRTTFAPVGYALKRRLLWVMLLRIGLLTVLLGATIILNYGNEATFSSPSPKFLLALIAITYLSTIVYAVWYRMDRAFLLLARLQLVMDLVLWGCLVYATGGIVSGFTTLFDLWVIVWAVVLGGRGAFHSAIVSIMILSLLSILMSTGALVPLADQARTDLTHKEFVYFLGVNVSALFLVASLVHSLVKRLETTDLGLQVEMTRRADLAQLHSDMIRSLTVGIATCENSGEVITMNPAGLDMLGLELETAEGEQLETWFPELKRQMKPGAVTRSRGRGTAVSRNGRRVPIDYIIAPLTNSEAQVEGFIVVFSDLTEVRRLESALEKSRRLAALGELAANLAHEIRNPLGAMSGAFQILSTNPNLGEEDKSLVDIVSREIQRMEGLVGEVLDYTLPQKKEMGELNFTTLVAEVVHTFKMDEEAADRVVEMSVDEGLLIRAAGAQIRQLMWNLLTNARQATEPGDRITVVSYIDDDFLVIEVRDTGRGIASEDISAIFDPFFSTREMGLGLGLALCRRVVEEHKGTIVAATEEGETVFRVRLPVFKKN